MIYPFLYKGETTGGAVPSKPVQPPQVHQVIKKPHGFGGAPTHTPAIPVALLPKIK